MTTAGQPAAPARLRSVVALLAAATLAVGAFGGCSASPGTAAVVGDRVISESTLMEVTGQLNKAGVQATPQAVLTVMIVSEDILAAAAKTGSWKPTYDYAKSVEQLGAALADLPVAETLSAPTLTVWQANSALGSMPTEARAGVLDAVVAKGVTVNPRYGSFSATQGLATVVPNWIQAAAVDATDQ